MKSSPLLLGRALIGALAFGLLSSALPGAERDDPAHVDAPFQPRLAWAGERVEDRLADRFIGAEVVGVDGDEQGDIDDLLLDPETGAVHVAIVRRGSFLGFGGSYHGVAFAALRWDPSHGHFVLEQPADWPGSRLPDEDWADAGVLVRADTLPLPAQGASRVAWLVRADALRGRTVVFGTREVGEIEGVTVDLAERSARVVLEPDESYSGIREPVLVPLRAFLFDHETDGRISARLTRTDFNALQPSWNQTTGPHEPPPVAERHQERVNERMAPTGRLDSPPVDPPGAVPSADARRLEQVAGAIREALGGLRDLEGVDVAAVPENGRIILRGSAPSAAQRNRLLEVARTAAGDVPVSNEVRLTTR